MTFGSNDCLMGEFMRTFAIFAAATAALISSPASAALVASGTACQNTDVLPTALQCTGFYVGNLTAAGGPTVADQQAALALLGFTWNGVQVEKLEGLGGNQLIDFTTLLTGISYVSIHFGNGQGGPGNGNATAFYKLDGGAGLDTFRTAYRASSSAVLYAVTPVVPEPATWGMMLLGFGIVGAAVRRRQSLAIA
jgi:PEP-CTERM motif